MAPLMTPQTAAGNSSDIVVASGSQVNVGLYQASGGVMSGEVVAYITRKNPSGGYDATGVALSGQTPSQVISGAGTYRVEKPATSASIGVQTD